jgi:3-isopropylmalate/(R)-2-methylmalate dehydratase small subunit
MAEQSALVFRGKALKYGDHVDTDAIIPARYLSSSDPAELASHCMENIDRDFPAKVKRGDIMVGGENFGCGSSREHAPVAIKASGVACVVAASFARIFYRNAVNIGLPILESFEASIGIQEGDQIEVDLRSGKIENTSRGKVFHSEPFPDFMREIINAGGLINRTKQKLEGGS